MDVTGQGLTYKDPFHFYHFPTVAVCSLLKCATLTRITRACFFYQLIDPH